ncbi:hypothetical protein GO009_16025 [Muricauda sp. TY007]|nr:hypothetical protein [Muricauda sp. TY007]
MGTKNYPKVGQGLSKDDFFEGVSIPRNKGLMRVYKDLELVEQLGSGVPRILQNYGKECFKFMDSFTRMIFPISEKVTEQVKNLIAVFQNEHSRNDLMDLLGLTHREHFRTEYLQRAIDLGLVEPTIPDKPKSSKQKYR